MGILDIWKRGAADCLKYRSYCRGVGWGIPPINRQETEKRKTSDGFGGGLDGDAATRAGGDKLGRENPPAVGLVIVIRQMYQVYLDQWDAL